MSPRRSHWCAVALALLLVAGFQVGTSFLPFSVQTVYGVSATCNNDDVVDDPPETCSNCPNDVQCTQTDQKCNAGSCSATSGCQREEICGDGWVQGSEECDDGGICLGSTNALFVNQDCRSLDPTGNLIAGVGRCRATGGVCAAQDGDGCSWECKRCTPAAGPCFVDSDCCTGGTCTSGICEVCTGTEICDNSVNDDPSCDLLVDCADTVDCPATTSCGVTAQCVAGGTCCGNGTTEAPEECDDGNITNSDGCSSTCQNEGATVTVDCCPGPISTTLNITIDGNTGCACTDGTSGTMTWDPAASAGNGAWVYDNDTLCGYDWDIVLYCDPGNGYTTPDEFQIGSFQGDSCVGPTGPDAGGASCGPLSLNITGDGIGIDTGACCVSGGGSTVDIIISE